MESNKFAQRLIAIKQEINALKVAQKVSPKIKFYQYRTTVSGLDGIGDGDYAKWYATVVFGDGENDILVLGSATVKQDYTVPAVSGVDRASSVAIIRGDGNQRIISFTKPGSNYPSVDVVLVATRPIVSFKAYAVKNRD